MSKMNVTRFVDWLFVFRSTEKVYIFEPERKRGVRKRYGDLSGGESTECVKRIGVRTVALIANFPNALILFIQAMI